MKVQRKWSLILGLIFLVVSVKQLVSGEVFSDEMSYNLGSLVATIAIPAFFLIFAFVGKKDK